VAESGAEEAVGDAGLGGLEGAEGTLELDRTCLQLRGGALLCVCVCVMEFGWM
jgi:hypothetical protein